MTVKLQLCSYHEDHNIKHNESALEYPTEKKNTSYRTENEDMKTIGATSFKKSCGLTSRIALLRALDGDDKPRSSTTRNLLNNSATSMWTWSTNDVHRPTYGGMRGLRFSQYRLRRHVTPRSPVQAYRRFGVSCCFHHQETEEQKVKSYASGTHVRKEACKISQTRNFQL